MAQDRREEPRLERADVVLTLPASFDASARELTVRRRTPGSQLLLIESRRPRSTRGSPPRGRLADEPRVDEDVLVVDVGGGTTDFGRFGR